MMFGSVAVFSPMKDFVCYTTTCQSSYMGGLAGNNLKMVFLWGAGMGYLGLGHYVFLVSD